MRSSLDRTLVLVRRTAGSGPARIQGSMVFPEEQNSHC